MFARSCSSKNRQSKFSNFPNLPDENLTKLPTFADYEKN
jgi:hypothetical protein